MNPEDSEFSHSLGRERSYAIIKWHILFLLFAKAKIEIGDRKQDENVTDDGVVLHELLI